MTSYLPVDPALLLAYALAALALVIAPGPGQALVLTRTVEGGTRGRRARCDRPRLATRACTRP
jgi:hypothetical protein